LGFGTSSFSAASASLFTSITFILTIFLTYFRWTKSPWPYDWIQVMLKLIWDFPSSFLNFQKLILDCDLGEQFGFIKLPKLISCKVWSEIILPFGNRKVMMCWKIFKIQIRMFLENNKKDGKPGETLSSEDLNVIVVLILVSTEGMLVCAIWSE
jgi:hypothetical protein